MSTRKTVLFVLFACLTLIFTASVEAQKRQKIQVEGLIYDLEHPDVERRRQAAILLGRHEIRQAVPALIRPPKMRTNRFVSSRCGLWCTSTTRELFRPTFD